ncbi:ABC transporter substrate-binding protein [Tissierella praeacuta]|uniref:ABC transporter substrate-binding protein n=1 Tax=Tissierella praeacuta TaxID=43131 RepID=UPI0028A80F4D|nr:ABC transporter substrate-binding protein [Tissierella praeacuta]
MKRRKLILLLMVIMAMSIITACSGEKSPESKEPTEATVGENKTGELDEEIPKLVISWGKSLHTGMMQLGILNPELFENNPIHLRPITDKQLELVKNGKVIALLDVIENDGGSDAATMMTQGNVDISYNSSTAMIAAYDSGADLCILCPIQSGGISIVADINAPYDTFEELVEYAKNAEMPIMGGYHSPISSPRIVLEYALHEEGLKVTGNTSDYDADVLMTDLKGISNLIPSLSSGQVELWAGPVPNPQNAEAQGIGKIIAKLDELPGGKWVDFPCCTMNARNEVKEKHPEVIDALIQVTTDILDFAQNNKEKTAELIMGYVGLNKEVLLKNDTTYSTEITDNFINGMEIYYDVMTDMGKFTGRLKDKPIDKVMEEVFDLSFMENK